MEISPFFFFLFAGLAIVFALMVVLLKNPVSSAFSLVLMFFSFAGIYAMLDAHLIAALQILVYAGAIMVLFVFVIMLLNADVPTLDFGKRGTLLRWLSAAATLSGLVIFSKAFVTNSVFGLEGTHTSEKIAQVGGNTQAISQLMFSDYMLPFELTSVLLLAAIVSAVTIAKRKRDHNDPNNQGSAL